MDRTSRERKRRWRSHARRSDALRASALAVALCLASPDWTQGAKPFLQAELLKTIKAKKAKVGDPVKARAANAVILPGGVTISEGTVLLGEVRAADSKSLAISFDRVELNGKKTTLKLSIRAAMMPGGPHSTKDAGNAPPEVTTRRGRDFPGEASIKEALTLGLRIRHPFPRAPRSQDGMLRRRRAR